MTEDEDLFLELRNEISLKNNYEHLHINLLTHKCGLRVLKNLIDKALEDFEEGRVTKDNQIIKAYESNRKGYDEFLNKVSLYFVGTKRPTPKDIKTVMIMYADDKNQGTDFTDDLDKYVKQTLLKYALGDAKTLDHAFKVTGAGKGNDLTDPRNLTNSRAYKYVSYMTEYIINDSLSMAKAYKAVQFNIFKGLIHGKGHGKDAKPDKNSQPDKNSLVDNFNLYKWYALNEYLYEKLTDFDNELTESQRQNISKYWDNVKLPRFIEQDLEFKLGG